MMRINGLKNFSYHNYPPFSSGNKGLIKSNSVLRADMFISSNKQISFSGADKTAEIKGVPAVPELSYGEILQQGLKRTEGIDIPAKNFKRILSPEALMLILPHLRTDNFISSTKNQKQGVYGVDLDYITTFSHNGIDNIYDVLDSVAEYSHYYYRKTGKNFVFAITDNDSVEGLKYALEYIGSNPEQFKHLFFVPGVKISFAHRAPNSKIGFENSKMLVYGINPFSENVNQFLDDTAERRKLMIYNFINDAAERYKAFIYKISEFAESNDITFWKDINQSEMYWRVREYMTEKGGEEATGSNATPEEIYNFAEDIFAIMDDFNIEDDNPSVQRLLPPFNQENTNILIKQLFEQYSTHYNQETGNIESAAENIYGSLVKCMTDEPHKPIMALSAPFYFSHYFESSEAKSYNNVLDFIQFLQLRSKGLLVGFESVAPVYDLDTHLTARDVTNFNQFIKRNTDLVEVGGSFATRNNDELPVYS